LNWKKYGRLTTSEYRKKVALSLLRKERTPKEIAADAGLHLSHVSNALKELTEMGLAECLSPDLRKGRVYGLTKEGKTIARRLMS
jgi:DNA-binding MarR family transcriptional regulator